jgi:hypothetical protein
MMGLSSRRSQSGCKALHGHFGIGESDIGKLFSSDFSNVAIW